MYRAIAVSVIWLVTLPCFGQTRANEARGNETRDRRLEDARIDITLLKRVVKEQDRRIAELESLVKTMRGVEAEKVDNNSAVTLPSKPSVKLPWQLPSNWSLIKTGMSRAQVEEILGPPISVDSVIDYQTLIYQGYIPATGALSGSVRLTDDRVAQVLPPGF
jgi:hypothetical protein